MSKNCDIMKRMKNNYEMRSRSFLTRRIPVIIRLDGKAFHTYTKGLEKPFDRELIEDMQLTAQYLCENIQGCKLAYTQSDEISLLLTDFDNLNSQAWFDYSVQKIVSVSASLATAKFNQLRALRYSDFHMASEDEDNYDDESFEYVETHILDDLAFFDSRAFNIPKEEVSNYFLARQKDAVKNSVSMLAQSLYSNKDLHKKNQKEMLVMCEDKGHIWGDLNCYKKIGSTIIRNTYINGALLERIKGEELSYSEDEVIRNSWEVTVTPEVFNEEYFKEFI